MVEMSAIEFVRCTSFTKVLFLLIIVLLGMNHRVSGKPVEWRGSSEEDILSGDAFLSVFMNSAEKQKYYHESEMTTQQPTPHEETDPPTTINNIILSNNDDNDPPVTVIVNNNHNEAPVQTEDDSETFTTILPKTNEQTVSKQDNELNLSNENSEKPTSTIRIFEKLNSESNKAISVKNNPSAIQSNSRRNDFSLDESEPITIDSNKPEIKVKRKSEDLLAIGANPDYIAQQHARINRDNQFNQPYNHRNPPSRARSVSYSAVIQVLPPSQTDVKTWKQDESVIKSKDYDNYDYTETYQDYNGNKNSSAFGSSHVASTAESKDYFVTRKYNPDEFNESGDKNINQPKIPIDIKKNYQTTERNWGIPEKVYGTPERPYGAPENQGQIPKVNYQTTERNWGIPEKGYQQYGRPDSNLQGQVMKSGGNGNYPITERNWGLPEKNYGVQQPPGLVYGRPEQNYEVEESVSVMTNGRTHGIQNPQDPPAPKVNEKPLHFKVGQTPVKPDDNQKIGYVVEGRNYRKYRVEERTPDGFIVGEYGVVSNNDGSLRGVRYTADGTINPRVIYDALMKFLSL